MRGSRSRVQAGVGREPEALGSRMMDANTMRVLGDFDERVLESRRSLEREIRTQLRDPSALAEDALERAQAVHAAGAGAVKAELERIEGWIARARAIRSGVQGS